MHKLDSSSLKKSLQKLNDIKVITEINRFVADKTQEGNLSVCYPMRESQKNKFHFLLDSRKKLTFFDVAEITTEIKRLLDLNYETEEEEEPLVINVKSLISEPKIYELWLDITPLLESRLFKKILS
jgi:hypothetical protein